MHNHIEHIDTEVLQCLNAVQAWHYKIIPFKKEEEVLFCYAESERGKDELEILIGLQLVITTVNNEILTKLLSKYYRKNDKDIDKLSAKPEDLVSKIIIEAYEMESSDIHIEILEEKARVRYRIDGQLQEKYILEKTIYPELVNKIKILSKLQIAEKRLPQDGRMDFKLPAITLDIRVSILPTLYGEKIVLRLLGTNAENIHFSDLGMNNDEKKQYLKGVDKSNGIILISGPTGSGKTTTLYATLNYLNNVTRNIVTIEDPIEYTLEGINQVQLKDQIGLSFPNALKSFLRQDPDIIMVGEIRDKETADMAIRASLTGHLVLSTIHTNSAKGTISRLIDMGIPPFLIADTLKLSMAQRLVRLLCNECKVEVQLDKSLIPQSYNVIDFEKVYESNGCPNCFYTGYKGRTAIFEIIYIDNELEDSIKKNMLNESLLKLKHITLGEKCLALLKQGKTTLKEIYPMLTNT